MKNVMIVASGTAIAQLLSIILLPIITRLYGPEAYGLMGTFIAIITIFTPIAALTLPIAIVIPKSDREARHIVSVCIRITIFIVLIFFAFIVIFHDNIIRILNAEKISYFIFLVPVTILLTGLFEIQKQWLIRKQLFSVIAKVSILQPLLIYGGMVGIGLFYPFASILIFLTSIKTGLSALIIRLKIRNLDQEYKIDFKDKKFSFKEVLSKYKDFPLYRAPEVFISAMTLNLPVILLTTFFGPTAAGFYTLARTSLGIPSQLIGKSVGDVFYPKIAEASNNNQNITKLILKSSGGLFLIGIIPFGSVIIFGPWMYSLVFGPDWSTAGEYARWIAFMSMLLFVNKPSVVSISVIRAQRFHLLFTIILSVFQLLGLYIGLVYYSDDILAIALFSILSGLLYFIHIIVVIVKSRKLFSNNL
ncbi:lipopolysaccharide biosynthesis protein [Halobacillus alkaliphilus]|nr:oligosaccharide flippase family protein [Halobacillus alkaliphilus]